MWKSVDLRSRFGTFLRLNVPGGPGIGVGISTLKFLLRLSCNLETLYPCITVTYFVTWLFLSSVQPITCFVVSILLLVC